MYEDLVGDAGDHAGDDYFDGTEFAIRRDIEDAHYWHVHRRRVIAGELSRFVAPEASGRLIELGCGIGTVATHLNAAGYHVDYSDVFGRGLEIARDRARAALGGAADERHFYRIDITRPIPKIEQHDGAMLFDVIEHLPDDDLVMSNVREGLHKSGAFVMVTVPAFQMLWSPWDDIEKHKRRYTKSQLVDLLQRTGFDPVRVTYFFGPLFFAALGMKGVRLLRRGLGLERQAQDISELTEGKSHPALNVAMLGALSPERAMLSVGSLPLGTSILAIARKRS